jgi:YfiH family protein
MLTQWIGDRRYLKFPRLSGMPGLVHAYSTKPHSMALLSSDDAGLCVWNRGQFARDLGLDSYAVTCSLQVHGLGIGVIDQPQSRVKGVDALITTRKRIPLMSFSADCPLLLIYAPEARVLALAHTSWRCTVAVLTMHVIERLERDFGVRPADLHAGVGPSAGPMQYEVGEEVREAARNIPEMPGAFQERDGNLYFDLWQANRAQLLEAGVPAERIEMANLCTMTEHEMFFSHRRGEAGRFALLAALID